MKMKVGEVMPETTGRVSIKYKTEMDVTARDIYNDVPLEVLQLLADYEDDELKEILLKLLLATRMDKNKVLKPGEQFLVWGEVLIQP